MEDPVPEAMEVSDAETYTLQDFGFVVAAFGKAIRPRKTNRIENFSRPVMVSFDAGIKLFYLIVLSQKEPIREQFGSLARIRVHYEQEIIFKAICSGQSRGNFKHECKF